MTPDQEDFMNKRFESFIQTQNELFFDFKNHLTQAVETQIKVTVNGKIDRLTEQVSLLNDQMKPVNETKKWFSNTKEGITWIAGFMTPIVIIGAFIKWVLKL